MAAMSVEPMPVAKQPRPPAMQACELPPAISSPGSVLPISMPSALWIAALPISYRGISSLPVRPRMLLRTVAVWMFWAGELTMEVTNTRLVSHTFSPCSSSRPIVNGEPRSSDQVWSTRASTKSPGRTRSTPAWAAMIFSVIVIPMGAFNGTGSR
jgi:hypothetical protein